MSTEGTYLSITKAKYNKPTVNISFNAEKRKHVSFKIRNKTRTLTLATLIQHSIGSPIHSN